MEPFVIAVPDAVLDDLFRRLAATRWADDFANEDWRYGANVAYIKELAAYWQDSYDWRSREKRMNAFSHFRTDIDGVPIHFIHERGKGPNPIPLILNHGWPWTFWDYQKLIGPLTDPVAYGGNEIDAFDVIVPSLPGYGFSTPLRVPGINWWKTADLWVKLMDRLGYARFATQGADWGAFISAQLGHKYADRVEGIHIQMFLPLDTLTGGHVDRAEFEPNDLPLFEKSKLFFAEEAGYMSLQSTKPQTPAVALADSPVGLLAWIVEKRRSWSDCQGDVESRFSKDDLLDTVMIYWITESYGTSARYYYEGLHTPWRPFHNRLPVVEAPVAIAVFPQEVVLSPKRWAEKYYNLQQWTPMLAGGHFGPMEEPQAVIDDLRRFFHLRR